MRRIVWAIAVLVAVVAGAPAPAAERVPGLAEVQRLRMPHYYGALVVSGRGDVLSVGQTCTVVPFRPSRRVRLRRLAGVRVGGCSGTSSLGGRPVIADVDADGVEDLLVGASIAYGRRGGGYEPAVTLESRSQVTAVAVEDVDGDDRPDVLIASTGIGVDVPAEVRVFTQGAPRDLRLRAAFDLPADARGLAVLHADGDRNADLVIGGAGLSLRRGAGDGTFSPGRKLAGGEFATMRFADVDGDRRRDLFYLDYSGGVTLLPRRADGFGPARTLLAARRDAPDLSPVMAVADLGGDRTPEVVLVSDDDLRVHRIRRGRLRQVLELDTAYDPRNLLALDRDEDGRADALVVADANRLHVVRVVGPGRRSRVLLPSATAFTIGADRSAHVPLVCTRGVGPCRGTLRLRGLGSEPFDVRSGGRARVRVPLRAPTAGPVRAVAGGARRVVVLRPANAVQRRLACRAGSTIAGAAGGRLFYAPYDDTRTEPVGCLSAVGAWYPLPVDVLRGPLAVFGRYALFHHELCDDTCRPRLSLADLRRRRPLGGIDLYPDPCGDACGKDPVAVAVGARGSFAWLMCVTAEASPPCIGSWSLYVLDGRGRRRVASGDTAIGRPRLRASATGRAVVLTGRGVRRSFRLHGAPRRGPGALTEDL